MNAPLFDLSRCPDEQRAFECGDETWSYAELRARVRECIARLESQDVGEGTFVAVHAPSGPEVVVLVHALWALRATLVPINLRLSDAERAAQLARVGHCPLLTLAEGEWEAEWLDNAPLDSVPKGMQLLLFTSGTTGVPKGALLSFEAIAASARAAKEALHYQRDERWLCCLPLYHVAGLSILYRCAFYGATLLLHPKFDAAALDHAVDEEGVTALSLVPTQLAAWLDVRGENKAPPTLRSVLLGGAGASPTLLERVRKVGLPLAPSFGMTETASQVCTLPPAQFAQIDLARLYLPPLPGVETRVRDEQGCDVPADTEGEVWLRGPSLFSGYLSDVDASSAAVASDGWFRTGDWGRRNESGALMIVERRSDLILSGGENVYPAEVEAALESHAAVVEAGVFARPDERWGSRVAAAVVLRGPVDWEQLEAHCRERLAGYKVPREFFSCEGLPRTPTGKLQRARLREQASSLRHS
ncbi:MAG: o-succinylbenzoate--CoA ligase [Chrysiogenetes bacterium]|nr:o-succinylbenzoate--CoA ligase [Chrysiogenetes bacterium]